MEPLDNKLFNLRKKNRQLLQEIESNSRLLQSRLQKLRSTTSVKLRSDESWEKLPPSPLKRKYDSWKARNNSSHVSAALNADIFSQVKDNTKSTMPDKHPPASYKVNKYTNNSTKITPAKRIKRNVTLASTTSQNKFKTVDQTYKPSRKVPPSRYRQIPPTARKGFRNKQVQTENPCLEDVNGEEKDLMQVSDSSSTGTETSKRSSDTRRRLKCLEEIDKFIDYSPRTTFLRKFTAVEEISPEPCAVASDCLVIEEVPRTNVPQPQSIAKKTQTRKTNCQSSQTKSKATCSKNCVEKKDCPSKIETECSDKSCCCYKRAGDAPGGDAGWFEGLNRYRRCHWFECHAQPGGISPDQQRCDCVPRDPSLKCSWFQADLLPPRHRCMYQYRLNERLFSESLCADHRGRDRCLTCHLPARLLKRPDGAPLLPVTIPSAKPRPARRMQSQGDAGSGRKEAPRGRRSSSAGPAQPLRRLDKEGVRNRVPVNSVALRYQEGIV